MLYFKAQMSFNVLIKTIYQKYKVLGTSLICVISLVSFMTLMVEIEMRIKVTNSLLENLYYLVVTMTTVGYGDISAKSFVGRYSIIIATCFGVIFEGMFLTAWAGFV